LEETKTRMLTSVSMLTLLIIGRLMFITVSQD